VTTHTAEAAKAKSLYIASLTPTEAALDWAKAQKLVRGQIADAIRASKNLSDVAAALRESGAHMLVFRQMLAPPTSQDQFRLICPEYPKATEKAGKPMKPSTAAAVATCFYAWRDRSLSRWLDAKRKPTLRELRHMMTTLEPLLACQQVGTARRIRMAENQETAIMSLLDKLGWKRASLGLIHQLTDLKPMQYARKTRFATGSLPQEVDIACGLKGTHVLAMECKVTNDETNSIKRVNDVLKKASAWKDHWGNFVETAALLQGVIKAADVQRLEKAGVHVFWSHDLAAFGTWIATKL
jgi:hypothetical protein